MKYNILKDKKNFRYVFFFISLIIFDQISKYSIISFFSKKCKELSNCSQDLLPIFDLSYVCNNGVSFGMLDTIQYGRSILSIIAIIAIFIFGKMAYNSKNEIEKISIIGIIGGAIGNLIDRLNHGCVTDFLHFFYRDYHFPIFNLADCFITIFGGLFIINEVLLKKKSKNI